jgi:hypothetical protein
MVPTPEVLVGASLLLPRMPSRGKAAVVADLPPVDELVNEDRLQFWEVVEQGGGDEDHVLSRKVRGCRQAYAWLLARVGKYGFLQAVHYLETRQPSQFWNWLARQGGQRQRQRREEGHQVFHVLCRPGVKKSLPTGVLDGRVNDPPSGQPSIAAGSG